MFFSLLPAPISIIVGSPDIDTPTLRQLVLRNVVRIAARRGAATITGQRGAAAIEGMTDAEKLE